jgi:hypothetical protein
MEEEEVAVSVQLSALSSQRSAISRQPLELAVFAI